MKRFLLLGLLYSVLIAQDEASFERAAYDKFIHAAYFGPRAGISTLPEGLYTEDHDSPFYSLFGWQVDFRYYPTEMNFIGFAEGGLLMNAVESGNPAWETWGYIGIRKDQGLGMSVGPNFSEHGPGIAFAPHYTYDIGNILVPITLTVVITNESTRIQITTGFSTKKR